MSARSCRRTIARPTRVLIVRQGPDDAMLRRSYRALTDAGFEVDVLQERLPGRPWRETVDGVRFLRLPIRRARSGPVRYVVDYAAFVVLATVVVTALHARRRYCVVQITTMPDVLVFAGVPARVLGARLVGLFAEPTPEIGLLLTGSTAVQRLLRRVEQASIAVCHEVITVTDLLRDHYVAHGADPDRIRVVLNATETAGTAAPGTAPPDDTFEVFTHGTVEERWGHEIVLRAVAKARVEVPEIRFRFCGKGLHLERVLDLAEALGIGDVVEYLGFVSDDELQTAMRRAHVGVVAQLSNPYSNLVHTVKMFDYFAAGVPVVASDLAATTAAFGDDEIACFRADDEESLAATLVRLAHDPDERGRLARSARALDARVGWAAQRDLYLRAFGDAPRRSADREDR